MNKLITFFISFLLPLIVLGQSNVTGIETKSINQYLTLEKREGRYVFKGINGNESQKYDYVNFFNDGFVETRIIVPLTEEEIQRRANSNRVYDRCGSYYKSNDINQTVHLLQLMVELKLIDNYLFLPFFPVLERDELKRKMIEDIGTAGKNGKYALVNIKGEILSDFKYNNPIYDNNSWRNNYFEKGKLISVILDKHSGKEIFVTQDSIVQFWDSENYLLKNKAGKYHLTFQSKKQKVNPLFRFVKALPTESSLFTYNNFLTNESGFLTLKGEKSITNLIPFTNFYKGHCIVVEVIKEEQKKNYYGELLPQKITRVLKIVNENFETVKELPEVNYISGNSFNRFGQIIATSHKASNNHFVMDYLGNHIIPPNQFDNRLKEVFEGLYEVTDYAYTKTKESQQHENFYNQKGDKLFEDNSPFKHQNLWLKTKPELNYLTSYGQVVLTLDKENNIIPRK